MNTILLNTISLDDGKVIVKGDGGGGVTINNQSKSVEITENGTTEVTADTGYTGLGKVTINTNVASSGGGGGGGGNPKSNPQTNPYTPSNPQGNPVQTSQSPMTPPSFEKQVENIYTTRGAWEAAKAMKEAMATGVISMSEYMRLSSKFGTR